MRETNEHDPSHSDEEVLQELRSDLHPDWELLSAPLERPRMDAMIDQAIARRGRREARPAKLSLLRRRWLPALAFGGALAAGLSLVLRTDDPDEAFALVMRPGRAQLRGEAPTDEASLEYNLRNEPLWTVHPPAGAAVDQLQLSLVAQTSSGLEVLRARVERTETALRVLGEVGELGLRPGVVTLHFVLGPGASDAEVRSRLEAHLAGTPLPSDWQVQSRGIRIKDG